MLSGEEQERKITTYEEAMNKIKDTTGVSDIKEVVQRFLSQGETQKHLEQLKTNNEKMLARLKEEKVYSDQTTLTITFVAERNHASINHEPVIFLKQKHIAGSIDGFKRGSRNACD